jgi:hypothetical protein
MFNLRIVHKRELALYAAQIEQSRKEIAELKKQVEHERLRAEGAINALLIRTNKIAITPNAPSEMMSEEQEEKAKTKMLNIFGDDYEFDEADLTERIQADGSK